MALRLDQIDDFVTLTLNEFQRLSWVDISLDLQAYVAMSRLLLSKKAIFEGGENIQWQVEVSHDTGSINTGLFAVDNINVTDHMRSATIPWTFQTVNYAYDQREDAFQSSAARIVSLLKTRRQAALNKKAVGMESNFWNAPANSTDQDEKLKPFGVDYWIQKNSTTGFNGGNPSGFSGGAGGIDSTVDTNWANWTAEYTNITKTDLIRKWREAATKTMFLAPFPFPNAEGGDSFAYYTNYDVLGILEELLEQQNESLGNDLASKDGRTLFRSNPVIWAPFKDSDTTDPVYGINWGVFQPIFKSGEFMLESPPRQSSNQHRVREVHIDSSMNIRCLNRRRLFVVNKAA